MRLAVLHVLASLRGDLVEENLVEMPLVDGKVCTALHLLASVTVNIFVVLETYDQMPMSGIADQVYSHSREGRMTLTLGGDHSVAIGTVAGVARATRERLGRDTAVVWVDAHADLNTIESTPSGNIHGMPLSFLLGLNSTYIPEFSWIEPDPSSYSETQPQKKPLLHPSKLVYIGLRDVDSGEKKLLKQHGIKAFSMHEVDKYGIGRVVEMALDIVNPTRTAPIHLSFDVDALDPSVAPSTGTPVCARSYRCWLCG